MPHIHTEPGHHDQTASAIIVRTDGSEPRVMLHRHKKLGLYLQFGGHIELDETPWQAIAHELEEESGYTLGQLNILQPPDRLKDLPSNDLHPYPICQITHRFSDIHNHTDTMYGFITDQEPSKTIAEGESTDIKLFSKAELKDFQANDIQPDIAATALFVLDVALSKWDILKTKDL